jgi:hypothetical protein
MFEALTERTRMTTNSVRQSRPERSAGRRLAAWPLVAMLAVAGAVGCSSGGNADVDEFLGTWTVDPVTSRFTLTCPFLEAPLDFPLWNAVRLEEGTLSDLVELAGPCPMFYDITKKGTATIVSPDPFAKAAPICRIDESTDTAQGYLELQFADWRILHLQPVKGEAPKGQLVGSANAPLFAVDAETGEAIADPDGACMFTVNANLTKISEN